MSLPIDTKKVNQFTFARFDPELSPEAKVTTWSDLFGSGGSVAVDVQVPFEHKGETRTRAEHLMSEDWQYRDEVPGLREWLQEVADEWNENASGNWRELVEASREKVADYTRRQAAEQQAKLDRIASGDWS